MDSRDLGKLSTFNALLDAGADMNARSFIEYSRYVSYESLIISVASLYRYDMVYGLLQRGADYKAPNYYGQTLASTIAEYRRSWSNAPESEYQEWTESETYKWLEKVETWLADRGAADE